METKSFHHYGIWIGVTLAVVLAGIYGGALVVLSRSQKAVAAQAAELAREIQREESMHVLGGLLRELSDETTKLDAFFVSPNDAVGVIEDVEALSSVVGTPASAADVRIEDQNPTTGEGTLSINIAASGTWRSMTHLLTLLDALPFQSRLDSVTLTSMSGEDETTSAQWSLRGLVRVPLRL